MEEMPTKKKTYARHVFLLCQTLNDEEKCGERLYIFFSSRLREKTLKRIPDENKCVAFNPSVSSEY